YFRNEKNLGAAPNYNRTFELSSGTFFKWLGHDDVLADGYLEKCLAPLLEHADVVMAFPGLTYIDGEGAVIRHQNRPDFGMMAELPGERTRQFIDHQKAGDDVFWSVFGLIRREALGKTHLIASYNASDQVLLMELLLQGKFYQVPEHLYLRREHHNASMTRHKSEAERLKWFDTSLRKKLIFTHWNLLFKHFKAIREFKPRDSLTCYLQICRRFFLREWRTMGGEIKLIAKQLIGIGRA
ncbi:MAG TPA: glycosyltransferase, partial [Calditrichia bacterium]|nr:glycosyltransferase [Calditrichia bacterium]